MSLKSQRLDQRRTPPPPPHRPPPPPGEAWLEISAFLLFLTLGPPESTTKPFSLPPAFFKQSTLNSKRCAFNSSNRAYPPTSDHLALDSSRVPHIHFTVRYHSLKNRYQCTVADMRQFLASDPLSDQGLGCQVALSHASCRAPQKEISSTPSGAQPYTCLTTPCPHTFGFGLPSTLHGPRPAGCQTGSTAVSGFDRYGACVCGAPVNG